MHLWWALSYAQDADPTFARPGLQANAYALFGRQYHGQVRGRSADAYYIPPHRLNPGSLEVHPRTTLQTRLTISTGRPLLGCEGCQPLDLAEPALAPLRIVAREEAWARELLYDPASRATVLRLMDGDPAGWREVYVQPGKLLLRRRPGTITPAIVEQWFADLDTLARVGETLAGTGPLAAAPTSKPGGPTPADLVTPIVVVLLAISHCQFVSCAWGLCSGHSSARGTDR